MDLYNICRLCMEQLNNSECKDILSDPVLHQHIEWAYDLKVNMKALKWLSQLVKLTTYNIKKEMERR